MYPFIHFENWELSTYFLTISIDFCLMLLWLRFRSQKSGLSVKLALDTGILASLGGLVGARLVHVIYEYPSFYRERPSYILKLWEGGYVFLGGIFFGIVTGVFWLRWHKQKIFLWLDLFAPIISLGYSLGRWACFFQGCCYGRPTDSSFGVHFEVLHDAGETFARYPTQILASFGELLLVIFLLVVERGKRWVPVKGQLFSLWMIGHGLNRALMETLRDDPRGPLILQMGISFWLAVGLILTGTVFYIKLSGTRDQSRVGRD